MKNLNNAYKHFKTITTHKLTVMQHCFRLGLYSQGLLHDLSKYSPTEFVQGMTYYQGTRSPNNAEREDKGYSEAWLHHKGRNKHHFEYWLDYSNDESRALVCAKMPTKYFLEMFCDRVAASKIYHGDRYTDADAYNYFMKSKERSLMNEADKKRLEFLLKMLKDKGEDYTFSYIKRHIKRKRFA